MIQNVGALRDPRSKTWGLCGIDDPKRESSAGSILPGFHVSIQNVGALRFSCSGQHRVELNAHLNIRSDVQRMHILNFVQCCVSRGALFMLFEESEELGEGIHARV